MRYYLCPGPTCMRKGINGLCGVVHEQMGCDVKNGDVFIFINKERKLMKLLHAEDGGMVMYVKRLEAGRFRMPAYDPESKTYFMEWRDLVVIFLLLKIIRMGSAFRGGKGKRGDIVQGLESKHPHIRLYASIQTYIRVLIFMMMSHHHIASKKTG